MFSVYTGFVSMTVGKGTGLMEWENFFDFDGMVSRRIEFSVLRRNSHAVTILY